MNHLKEGKLSHKELIRQLDYDPITGILRWKIDIANSKIKAGSIAGAKHLGYIRITINYKSYLAHRLAWFHYYGYIPENDIDHRNQKKYCNWILNLRQSSKVCNQRNKGNQKNNTSGIKGVHWSKNDEKWMSYLYIKSKSKYLGLYEDFSDAVCARLAGEQCVNWTGCDSNSPAYKYVKESIQCH